MTFWRRIVCNYNHWLLVYPYRTQLVQISAILGVGDVLAQKIENKPFDPVRTAKFMSCGIFIGPGVHAWFLFLEKTFGKSKKSAIYKVIADQLVFAPLCMALMITYINALKGQSWEEIKIKLTNDYPGLLIDNYKVWPLAQLINFALVPLNFRVLFLQTLGIFWNAYLSWKLSSDKVVDPKAKKVLNQPIYECDKIGPETKSDTKFKLNIFTYKKKEP